MSLLDTDLLYVDRAGTLYQITWANIKTRSINSTDQFLIQRGTTYYRVPIGDFWTCTEVSTVNDYYLIERNGELRHETILFPCEVQIDVTAATSTVVYLSGTVDPISGDPSFIQNPDGTRTFLTTTPTAYTLTQNGSYLIGGNITQFQIQSSDGRVDASPTPANVWDLVFSGVPNFGEKLFTNISLLTGLPAGLVLESLDRTFEGTSPDTADLNNLDVSAVTSAVATFLNSSIDSGDDISGWDVSNVTNMSRMFEGTTNFNVDISGWDIAAVTDMSAFLKGASVFDQDLSAWATPIIGVTNMASMFEGAQTFNQDLSTWDVSTMIDASSMFNGASSFNQDLGDWDVSDMRTADSMFEGAIQYNQDLTEWCVNAIPTEPTDFKTNSSLSAANSPPWGSCQTPQCGEMYYISGGSRITITGTTTQAAPLTDPRGVVSTVGPGNFSYSSSYKGTHILPVDYLTKLSFDDNYSQQFDFAPCFYTGNITDMSLMFNGCKVFNGDVANWDTSKVTNTFKMFENAQAFNGDVSTWDVSANTDARRMFMNARVFDQDISSWDMSKVLYAQNFFRNASSFNQDLSSWDFSSALNLGEFFWNAVAFNGDISGWDVSSAVNLLRMFNNASLFSGDISAWNTASVTNMQNMFLGASAFDGAIGGWDVGNVTDMIRMFQDATLFNQDLNTWNVGNVTNMSNMFLNATAFNQSLNDWDVTGIPTRVGMYGMFNNATSMQGDISEWCVGNLSPEPVNFDRSAGFENNTALLPTWGDCPISDPTGLIINDFNGDDFYISLTFASGSRTIIQPDGTSLPIQANRMTQLTQLGQYEIPMGTVTKLAFNGRNSTIISPYNVDFTFESGFYTGALTNMFQTFRNAQGFNGDISGWDVSKVTNMNAVFMNATSFNGDISSWDVSKSQNFSAMFSDASAFDADISEWDTAKSKNTSLMFENASAFNQDLSLWNLSNVTNMSSMFENAATFDQYLNPWDVSAVTNMREMFRNATAMQGDISNWCVSQFSSEPSNFDVAAGFEGDATLLPTWGECKPFNGIYLKELVGGVGDFVIGGVASDGTVSVRRPDGTVNNIGSGTFANKYTQLGWYEIKNMDKLTGLRFFDNDILFDDTSETADFYFSTTFDTSGLTESRQMFREAMTFNGDISMFDLSGVTNMAAMFRNAAAFTGDVTGFPTENVTNMSNMFRGAISIDQDISGWSVYSVTSMSDMFRDAVAFDQDLSNWCVPLIASTPSDFATGSPLAADVAKQPGWGTCPNQITIVTPPVIANENGTVPAPYSEEVVITADAVTSPAGATPTGYQWQTSTDDVTWIDVDASKNVGNQATYTPNGHDRDLFIRVNVSYSDQGVPDTIASSNSIRVEDTDPPLAGLYTTSTMSDFPLGLKLGEDSVYGTQRVCLTAPDGMFYAYPYDLDILTIWSPATGDYIEFRELDYDGAGINADTGWDKQYWDGGIAVLGETKHLLIPDYVRHFWMYDYVANTWEQIASAGVNGIGVFSGVVYSSVTGKYYSVPRKVGGDIWEIDTTAKTASVVFSNAGTEYGFSTAAEGPDGKIYLFANYQLNGPHFAQFDPTTGVVVPFVSPINNTGMWDGVRYQVYSNAIYSATSNTMIACPCNANSFIKLDFNNIVGGLPAISEVTQTVDTRTAADGTTQGKWHTMVLREDGRFQCCAAGPFENGGRTSRNAIYDPATDTCIDDGLPTVGSEFNNLWIGGVMSTSGRIGSPLASAVYGSGGTNGRVFKNAMWDSFTPITTYDPNHPKYNYNN